MGAGAGELKKDRSFFTFASGKKYLKFAFTLARSYRYHNQDFVPFYIVSDESFDLPRDLHWVKKKTVTKVSAGRGLAFKLNFFEIAPSYQSVFIDADSIIYGNITHLFDLFTGDGLNVIGHKINDGEWAGELTEKTLKEFDIRYLVRYCGAFYYICKNQNCCDIFSFARELQSSNRKFQQLGSSTNEEPLLSIAMAKYRVTPVLDDGNIWGDVVQLNYHLQLNVFKGPTAFNNSPGALNYKFWLPQGSYRSKILHVGSSNYNKKPWLFDSMRLKLHYKLLLPVAWSNLIVNTCVIPVYIAGRKLLRP